MTEVRGRGVLGGTLGVLGNSLGRLGLQGVLGNCWVGGRGESRGILGGSWASWEAEGVGR